MRPPLLALLCACTLMALVARAARAEDLPPEIKLEGGHYTPAELSVPANTTFKLRVTNADAAAIEFESFELHRERVVQPGETITVYMPAMAPGTYKYIDDFHPETPEGTLIAK